MPNSAERSNPITATIMIVMLFVAFGLLAWAIKHEAETHYPPKYKTEIKK